MVRFREIAVHKLVPSGIFRFLDRVTFEKRD